MASFFQRTTTQIVGTIVTDNAERAAHDYLLSDQTIALIRKGTSSTSARKKSLARFVWLCIERNSFLL